MRVRMLSGRKEVREVKDGYARRLIEQGKAVAIRSGAKKPQEKNHAAS